MGKVDRLPGSPDLWNTASFSDLVSCYTGCDRGDRVFSVVRIADGWEYMTTDAKIRDFIRQNFLFGSDDKIGENDSLLDRGIIDSTGAMELVSFLENEFSIEVGDRDLVPENLDSVAAITAFVMRKTAEKQQPIDAIRAIG